MSSSPTIVLITGANSGVGYATAQVITSKSSAYHVIVCSRNLENGKKAVSEIQDSGNIKGNLSALQLDVTDDESIANAVKDVEQQFGHLDILVNNAGIGVRNDSVRKEIELTIATNVAGPAAVTEAFKPLLLKSKSPYSIYVTSAIGSLGLAADPNDQWYKISAVSYRMSKAALNMWMVEESKALSSLGVKSFSVCPGFVISNIRGKSEEARLAGGHAGDPLISGQTILDIIEGKRDAQAGTIVHRDGVYPW